MLLNASDCAQSRRHGAGLKEFLRSTVAAFQSLNQRTLTKGEISTVNAQKVVKFCKFELLFWHPFSAWLPAALKNLLDKENMTLVNILKNKILADLAQDE